MEAIQIILLKINYEKINIDDSFPEYIYKNKKMFKDWIL